MSRATEVMQAAGAVGRAKGTPGPINEQEILLGKHLIELHYGDFECEYKFHPTRKWRFDFAVARIKLAIEIEGGIWTLGRHTRGEGFANDCEKYNEAVLMGWRVLRFPVADVLNGKAREVLKRFKEANHA